MREIHRIIVGAFVETSDGYVAFGKKHPGPQGVYGNNCWHIPGGGLEEGETKQEGLVREVKEELELDISAYEPVLLDDKGTGTSNKTLSSGEEVLCHMQFFVYRVFLPTTHINVVLPKSTEEFIEIRWVYKHDIANLELTPPGRELLERISI